MSNVRISKKGRKIITNKVLSGKIVDAVCNNKHKLTTGEPIEVPGYLITVRSATSGGKNK